MAFDKSTRNLLSKMVASCRDRLIDDIRDQLQSYYGLYPDGSVLDIARTERERQRASDLRDLLEHFIAVEAGLDKKRKVAAYQRLVREISFTTLNRLAALRLCEERGIVIDCIGKGMESDGFRLYDRMTGGALGNRYQTYQAFIEGLFDEIALDLGVLFDRDDPQSHFFPSESALNDVLAQLTDSELDKLGVWQQDETIGWIYQYYNDPKERKAMKNVSQEPRNSRELAIRNQFFTPRYVVEFLTDNTLGRIWYEMRRGKTRLVEECHYLVLKIGEYKIEFFEGIKKDPRDLKILDPACGSGHFLLYSFNLLTTIYYEAWFDSDIPPFTETGTWLVNDYPNLESLRHAVPGLILRHNLFGVDIDQRAVQIAALALWLRAQREFQKLEIKSTDRPGITKTNLVTAEPMPGDQVLLNEFIQTLHPPLLGSLTRVIFEKMKLAGEAGLPLKIQDELVDAVSEAKEQWLARSVAEQLALWPEEKRSRIEQLPLFDLSGISDDQFWETAEEQVIEALEKYTLYTSNGRETKRKLFVEDAAQGFAFIELSQKRFDVILMNPPFGEISKKTKKFIQEKYDDLSNDIYSVFIKSSLEKIDNNGYIGAITPRNWFARTSFSSLRDLIYLKLNRLNLIADLGANVLDGATNEVACYTISGRNRGNNPAIFLRLLINQNKEKALAGILSQNNLNNTYIRYSQEFQHLPKNPITYWVPQNALRIISKQNTLEPTIAETRQGLVTGDNFRFVRLLWEVPSNHFNFSYFPSNGELYCKLNDPVVVAYRTRRDEVIRRWAPLVLAGESQPWFSPMTVVVNWKNDGEELKNFRDGKGKLRSRPQNLDYYFRPGFSWTLRAFRLIPYAIPAGSIPTASRYMGFPTPGYEKLVLGIVASNLSSVFSRFYGNDFARPVHLVNTVSRLPIPPNDKQSELEASFEKFIDNEIEVRRKAYLFQEPFFEFLIPRRCRSDEENVANIVINPKNLLTKDLDQQYYESLGIDTTEIPQLEHDLIDSIIYQSIGNKDQKEQDLLKQLLPEGPATELEELISYAVGVIFGIWDIRFAIKNELGPRLQDPFKPLPICPPGTLVKPDGLPAISDTIVSEAWLRTRPDANTLPEVNNQGLVIGKDGREYPSSIPNSKYPFIIQWDGILVDDPGLDRKTLHSSDIVLKVRETLKVLWPENHEEIEAEACEILGVKYLREYFRKPTKFFADHLKRYTKSRRKAPIYWPFSTSSGSYTLWIYYHRLDDEILYTAVNRYVEPKIENVERHLAAQEKDLAKLSGKAASELKDQLEDAQAFLAELREFRDELLRIAALPYKPNLNDGVIINAAPFHKLFRLTKWARETKKIWDKLETGEYDWAHLAYTIWPERVREGCKKNKSIAIAHGLEEEYEG